MSDYRRPVDELPVKNEGTLSLTDTLIGVDAVAEPAAFQAQLGEIAARLVGPIADDLPSDAGFMNALIASILGPDAAGISPFYETGSFAPTIIGESSNPSVVYNSQSGHFIRIGDLVWFVIYLATSSISGGSGTLRFAGLPYTVASGQNPPIAARPQGVDFGSGVAPYAFGRGGTTEIGLGFTRTGASPVFPAVSAWAGNASIGMSGSYIRQ